MERSIGWPLPWIVALLWILAFGIAPRASAMTSSNSDDSEDVLAPAEQQFRNECGYSGKMVLRDRILTDYTMWNYRGEVGRHFYVLPFHCSTMLKKLMGRTLAGDTRPFYIEEVRANGRTAAYDSFYPTDWTRVRHLAGHPGVHILESHREELAHSLESLEIMGQLTADRARDLVSLLPGFSHLRRLSITMLGLHLNSFDLVGAVQEAVPQQLQQFDLHLIRVQQEKPLRRPFLRLLRMPGLQRAHFTAEKRADILEPLSHRFLESISTEDMENRKITVRTLSSHKVSVQIRNPSLGSEEGEELSGPVAFLEGGKPPLQNAAQDPLAPTYSSSQTNSHPRSYGAVSQGREVRVAMDVPSSARSVDSIQRWSSSGGRMITTGYPVAAPEPWLDAYPYGSTVSQQYPYQPPNVPTTTYGFPTVRIVPAPAPAEDSVEAMFSEHYVDSLLRDARDPSMDFDGKPIVSPWEDYFSYDLDDNEDTEQIAKRQRLH